MRLKDNKAKLLVNLLNLLTKTIMLPRPLFWSTNCVVGKRRYDNWKELRKPKGPGKLLRQLSLKTYVNKTKDTSKLFLRSERNRESVNLLKSEMTSMNVSLWNSGNFQPRRLLLKTKLKFRVLNR
jgi:hypothetical protein